MRNILLFGCVLALCGCARTWRPWLSPCDAPGATPGVAALRLIDGYPAVPVSINGREVGCLLVETGSTATVIDPAVAAQLGLTLEGEDAEASQLWGAPVHKVYLPAMRLGGIAVSAHLANAAALALPRQLNEKTPGARVVGSIGSMCFERQPVTIDLAGLKFIAQAPGATPPAEAIVVPLRQGGPGYWQVPVVLRATRTGEPTEVQAWVNTRWLAPPNMPRGVVESVSGQPMRPAGIWIEDQRGGSGPCLEGEVPVVQALGQTWTNLTVQAREPGKRESIGWQPQAILGLPQLRGLKVTFDLPQQRLWVATPAGP